MQKTNWGGGGVEKTPSSAYRVKMGTSSKAQFTLTVTTVTVYIAKANVLMGILFILLYQGFETLLL